MKKNCRIYCTAALVLGLTAGLGAGFGHAQGDKPVVVKKDPALTADTVLQHCREHLTAYKCPRDVEFRSDLPKSNVGKILRRELREEARKAAAQA